MSRLFKGAREAVWLDEDEKEHWTMFGLWFLISLPHEFHVDKKKTPLIPPSDEFYRGDIWPGTYDDYNRDDYIGSYIHRIQWVNS